MEDIVFLEGFQIFRVSENPWHTQVAPLSRGILRAFKRLRQWERHDVLGSISTFVSQINRSRPWLP